VTVPELSEYNPLFIKLFLVIKLFVLTIVVPALIIIPCPIESIGEIRINNIN